MPKAILFDLGDTVLKESSYNVVHGFKKISKYFSPNLTFESLNEATETFQVGTCEFKLLQWISENLSSDHASTKAEAVELELWKETVSLVPIHDIQSVLDFLLSQNIRIAAVSNAIFSSSCMTYELAKHGLGGYFEFVLSSADLGIRKPDPRIFESALESLELKPQEVWFIGDKWDADVIGAHAVQMTPVWFKEYFPDHDAGIAHIKLRKWSDFEVVWNLQAS